MKTSLVFDPLLPLPIIGGLAVLLLLVNAFGRWRGLKSFLLRSLAFVFIALALFNPQKRLEDRKPLPNIVLLVKDKSESMRLNRRDRQADQVEKQIKEQLIGLGNFEIVKTDIKPGQDGSLLAASLIDGLGQLPADRIAGVLALTDGLVHDLPENPGTLLPKNVPFHGLIIGDKNARDRRIEPLLTPRYGMVGETTEYKIRLEDKGHESETARLEIRLNGKLLSRFDARIGDEISIPVRIEKRGTNTIEIRVAPAERELTPLNNVFVSEISGVRDRLRVLLITGEPHMGARAWRNLLKSDPSVDLIQFTILTNPGVKNTFASPRELSLIRFPARELFEEKLDEFDLIIFDQFKQRTISGRGRSRPMLSPYYIANIAKYVENGGSLLVAAGPPFAGEESLAKSPLIVVLPARPTGEMSEKPFRPKLSGKGKRHPITDVFDGETATRWGRWYRSIDAEVIKGDVLMEGAAKEPLLIIDKVKKGRVALLLSDQAWLWSKDHDNGGPYNELFRRLAHWLMSEPDLEADRLDAHIENGQIVITHWSLDDQNTNVNILGPDGHTRTLPLKRIAPGQFTATTRADQQGAYRISSEELSTIAAAGALNPTEFKTVIATQEKIANLTRQTNGHLAWVGKQISLPNLKKVRPGAKTSGANFMGLVDHKAYTVTASRRTPLAPAWVFVLLILGALLLAWRFEGR